VYIYLVFQSNFTVFQDFPVHRVILAGSSPYFRSLFTPSAEEVARRSIGTDSKTLQSLLDFCYTGKCSVSGETVNTLLSIADHFAILGVVQLCCKFLMSRMEPETCLGIYKFARQFFCPQLLREGRLYILYHFKQVLRSAEFLELEFEELEDLLRDDLLNIRNEEMVFEAIKKWMEFKPGTRNGRLVELLQCIRFGLMSYRYFTTIVLPWKCITASQVSLADSIFH
jgi:kelch-like protein 10